MNDSLMQEILKRLDSLGEQLGAGAQYTWAAMMRQELVVNGWGNIVMAFVFAIIATALVKLAFWVCRPAPDSGGHRPEFAIEDETGRALGVVFSVIGAAIAAIFAIVCLWEGAAHLLNPSYYALMDLAQMLTGK